MKIFEETYNPKIPLDKKEEQKKKKGNIIDISADDVFISMDQPLKKAKEGYKKERVKSKKPAKLKRKTCRCK